MINHTPPSAVGALQPAFAGGYAKIALITLLPAIVGGVVGHKAWKAHHVIGMVGGAILFPILTLLAVNYTYPGGVNRFTQP